MPSHIVRAENHLGENRNFCQNSELSTYTHIPFYCVTIAMQHKADGSEEFLHKMLQAQKSWMCKTLKTASPKGNFALTQISAFLNHPQGHRSARTFAKGLWSPVKLFSCPGGADTFHKRQYF